MLFDRRSLLIGGTGLCVHAATSRAAAPKSGKQTPAFYRMNIGDVEVTALCDGYLDIPTRLFPGVDQAEADSLASQAFYPPGPVPTAVNAFVLNFGDRVALVDTGTGNARGASLGHVVPLLKAAGIEPTNVDAILMTHLHIDHCAGLFDASKQPVFPNAELLIAEAEHRFWSDVGLPSRANDVVKISIPASTTAIDAYRGRTTLFRPGEMLLGRVESIPLPGHTPGHTGFAIGTGNNRLVIWADIVHVAALQLPKPDWSLVFDVDGKEAAATRRRMFDMAAADRLLIAGMHLPFPAFGRVVRKTEGYAFVADPWRANL